MSAALPDSYTQRANLTEADRSGADLTGASLDGADLTGIIYDSGTQRPEGFVPLTRPPWMRPAGIRVSLALIRARRDYGNHGWT
ncbi:pentapeptide repeat-containing protein, partial [Nocardia sp. NPDC051750]|uniref:pentapeptide repeat-containing protein n=1 Tax=Nocardia sp. NPDC051750 TaxID=3364325 RepID=UPI0037934AA1